MKIPALAAAAALAGCAHFSPPTVSMQDATTLAAAESAFAAHSVREDMRVAFIEHFAPDGVFVRNGWVVAKDYLAARPAPPIVLDWKPVYAEAAACGEMGLATGPWKLTSKADPSAPPAYGQFVSIWTRTPGGRWKVAVDLGISHAEPALWNAPLQTVAKQGATGRPTDGIDAAERRFARDSQAGGMHAGYARHASPSMRFYRSGANPSIGRDAVLNHVPPTSGHLLWTVDRTATARSRDFGYALGSYAAPTAPDRTLGWFLRVWRLEGNEWRIALDVVNPRVP